MEENLKEKQKKYKEIASIMEQIESNEIEIENLEEEMYTPGADMVLLGEQMEKIKNENNMMYEKLRKMGVSIDEKTPEKKMISIGEVSTLFGKKLKELKRDFSSKIKSFASKSKDAIMKRANEIAAKKKQKPHKSGKVKLANILLAVAVAGCAGDRIWNAITNGKPISTKPNPSAGVEDITENESKNHKEVTEPTTEDVQVASVTPRFIVNKNNLYKAHVLNNNVNKVNFRSTPSTENDSNIIMELEKNKVIYVKENSVDITNDGDHEWRKCIVFEQNDNEEKKYEGYVDANLLVADSDMDKTAIFESNDIEVIVDDDRAVDSNEEIQLDAYKVNVGTLNLRDEPNLVYGKKIDKLYSGDVVYSYNGMEIEAEDPEHDWKHVMYEDGNLYRTCFVDGKYLAEGADFNNEIEQEDTTEPDAVAEQNVTEPTENTSESMEIDENTVESTTEPIVIENNAQESNEYDDVQQFSEYPGYVEYLTKLKEQHPNWVFIKDDCGKDFYECVDQHRRQGAVTVEYNGNWGSEWFYYDENGNMIYEDSPNWYVASNECIAAMMDPRNFINEVQIFQFEDTNETAKYITLEDVKQVFSGVKWANAEKFSYMDTNKQIVTLDKSFAEIVYDECQKYNFNPLVAASAIITEQGIEDVPVAKTGKGTIEGYEGYYNYGNVGAYAYAYPGVGSAGECGLIRAQKEGWTSPEVAIDGYIEHEVKSFSQNGKDTKYLRKFDIKGNGAYVYMTSFAGAYNEAKLLYQGSNLDQVHVFKIPVFNNMPEKLCELPGKPGMIMDNINSEYEISIEQNQVNAENNNYSHDEEER